MISLTKRQIESALQKLNNKAVEKYLWLQGNLYRLNVGTDTNYQKTFSGYYRVRRKPEWKKTFFGLLENHKKAGTNFESVLDKLYKATGRMESSFSSKFVGTIHPELPIIDSIVLKNLGLRLPAKGTDNRASAINAIHQTFIREFADFLKKENGKYLTRRFRETYPAAKITEVKILDFVLWATR